MDLFDATGKTESIRRVNGAAVVQFNALVNGRIMDRPPWTHNDTPRRRSKCLPSTYISLPAFLQCMSTGRCKVRYCDWRHDPVVYAVLCDGRSRGTSSSVYRTTVLNGRMVSVYYHISARNHSGGVSYASVQ